MRRTTLCLSAALAAALGYAGFLRLENARLRDAAAAAAETPAAERAHAAEAARAEADAAAPGAPDPRAPEPAPAVAESAPPSPEQGGREDWRSRRRERAERVLEAFDDPEMRLDMVERQMERIDGQYGAFFRKSGLTPEEIDAVKTLLAEREVTRWEERMRAFSLPDEEAREALRGDMEARRLALTAEIATALGEDEMAQFEFFEEGLPYRRDVERFASSLSYTETPLSEAQAERLVARIAEVDRDFEFTKDLSELRRRGMDGTSPEDVERYFAERAARDELLVANARAVLEPDQLRAFAERRLADRERDRREMEFRLRGGQRAD